MNTFQLINGSNKHHWSTTLTQAGKLTCRSKRPIRPLAATFTHPHHRPTKWLSSFAYYISVRPLRLNKLIHNIHFNLETRREQFCLPCGSTTFWSAEASVFCFCGLTLFSTSLTDILIGGGFVVVSMLIELATLLQSTSFALSARGIPLSSSLKQQFKYSCVEIYEPKS